MLDRKRLIGRVTELCKGDLSATFIEAKQLVDAILRRIEECS